MQDTNINDIQEWKKLKKKKKRMEKTLMYSL